MSGDMTVRAGNFDLLKRLDQNRDGTITRAEANDAIDNAGIPSEVAGQLADLSAEERSLIQELRSHEGSTLQVTFDGAAVGRGSNSWSSVESRLQQQAASQASTAETRGQGRVNLLESSGRNNDCGQANGEFMHERRLRAHGRTPAARTHAQVDASIQQLSVGDATTPSQMQKVMQANYADAGGTHYTFQRQLFTNADQMVAAVRTGLAHDPGGVMVPINYRQTTDSKASPHWITVTGISADGTVSYYDPGGIDGSDHMHTMTLSELRGAAIYDLPQMGVIYGVADQAGQSGHLSPGTRIMELEVRLSNRDLHVQEFVGTYRTQAEAEQQARTLAGRRGMDGVVVREGSQFAVYGMTEIRTKFGGLWSDNTLTDVNPNVVAVMMTDPRTGKVRPARLP